jgi:hypothetical protein
MSNNICAYKVPKLGDKTLEQCHSKIQSTSIMNNMVGWFCYSIYIYTTSGLKYLKNSYSANYQVSIVINHKNSYMMSKI